MCIHLMGPPGAGSSTLGAAIAAARGLPFLDADAVIWLAEPDGSLYRRRRNAQHRLQVLTDWLDAHPQGVLSGAICGWGDAVRARLRCVLFVDAGWPVRRARILAREEMRYGATRLGPGGDLEKVLQTFLQWAGDYDTPSETARCRTRDLQWLEGLACPVHRVNGALPLEDLLPQILPLLP